MHKAPQLLFIGICYLILHSTTKEAKMQEDLFDEILKLKDEITRLRYECAEPERTKLLNQLWKSIREKEAQQTQEWWESQNKM